MGILEVRDKVQRYLLDMGINGVEVMDQGGLTFRVGSSRTFAYVAEHGEGESAFTVLDVSGGVAVNLKPTPDLYEFVARSGEDYVFGHFSLVENKENGTLSLLFVHRILGDYLDPEELKHTVTAVAATADKVDNDLAARFGGTVYHED